MGRYAVTFAGLIKKQSAYDHKNNERESNRIVAEM